MSKLSNDIPSARPSAGLPDVTVTVMSYNNARFLRSTIDSVLAQAGVLLELIVHDDCSSDDSVAILKSYAGTDPRFSFSVNEHNLGAFRNYNRCLESGSGRYAVVLGSDDILYPGHLSTLVAAMDEHSHCDLGYVQCNWVDENGNLIRHLDHPGHAPQSYFGGRNELADLLRFDNYITPSAAMLRRSALERLRLPDGSIHYPDMPAGDWELWCRLATINPNFVFLRQASVAYRVHGGQISQKFFASDAPVRDHARILELVFSAVRGTPNAAKLRPALPGIWAYFQQRLSSYPDQVRLGYRFQEQRLRAAMLKLIRSESGPITQPSRPTPLVSVIVPTKDRPDLLRDALASLASQHYSNWEALVVNDGGCDISPLVSGIDDSHRIRVLVHASNRGLPAARNTALAHARGQIICYLDDDDIFLPDHLDVVVGALAEPQREFVYTDAEYVTERLDQGTRIEVARDRRYVGLPYSRERLHCRNFIPVVTWAHRRELLDRTGIFDESLPAFEDWDLLLRIAAVTEPMHIETATVEVRVRANKSGNMTSAMAGQYPRLYRLIYERHGDLGLPQVAGVQAELLAREEEAAAKLNGSAKPAVTTTEHRGMDDETYREWLQRRSVSPQDAPLLKQIQEQAWGSHPRLHLILRVDRRDFPNLAKTFDSLNGQIYDQWRADVISTEASPGAALDGLSQLAWHTVGAAADAKLAIDLLVAAHGRDLIAELPPGALLDPMCLFRIAHEAATRKDATQAFFTDDDSYDGQGVRGSPRLKPDFDIEWVRCSDLTGPVFVAAEAWRASGGASESPVRPWYDLVLRLSDCLGSSAFAHIAEPLLSLPPHLAHDGHAAECRAAATRHLRRRRLGASVEPLTDEVWRIRWHADATPQVTIAIPSLDRPEMLGPCIDAILHQTAYPDYEILIIDGGSRESDTHALYDRLRARTEAPLRIANLTEPFCYAAYANLASREAVGELLLLLGDDIRVFAADWLNRLVGVAIRPDVAAAGPRIVNPPSGRMDQFGLILGMNGIAGTPHHHEAGPEEPGYLQILQVDRSAAALPGACLLARRSEILNLGVFDTDAFGIAHADIDICLRASAVNDRHCVATAGVTVVKTGGSCLDPLLSSPIQEAERMAARLGAQERLMHRWFDTFAANCFWSKHLDSNAIRPAVESRIIPQWHALPLDVPRILAFPVQNAQGDIRIRRPLAALRAAGKALSTIYRPDPRQVNLPSVIDLARHRPDSIVAHQLIGPGELTAVRQWREFLRDTFIVYSIDDLLTDMPAASSLRAGVPADSRSYLARTLQYCDRLVVSTPFLAEAYGHLAREVRIVPNRLEREVWMTLKTRRGTGQRPRIGWAGGTAHTGDLLLIAEVVAATANEADWVFMGMCPDALRPYVKEFHPFTSFDQYPQRLAALDLDIAVAPLEQIPFNRGKSNLRLLEYGALGIPVVCTDIDPYRDSPACKVANLAPSWIEALRARIHDPDAAAREGATMRQWVQEDYILEDFLDEWLAAHRPA